jgi:4-alpha-glucanotransferase
VFDAVEGALGDVAVVAENLGVITPPVERLRTTLGFLGTVVLQFTFADGMVNPQRGGIAPDDVVYTGTHDNDTATGWWMSASGRERARVAAAVRELGRDDTEPHWMFIRIALDSAGAVTVIPAQDVLGLDGTARTNVPGRAAGNWNWRLRPGQLDASLAARLLDATDAAGRLP